MSSKPGEYMNGIRKVKHGNSGLHPTTVGTSVKPRLSSYNRTVIDDTMDCI
jgi:hypothetical protein